MKNLIFFYLKKDSRGFQHFDNLKVIAAIAVIVALVAPSLSKYLKQFDFGTIYFLKFTALLVVTVLFIALITILIHLFLNRDTETKEEHAYREQQERCVYLREQALASCRRASGNEERYQKTWKKPKNNVVQQAIWGIHPVENPRLFEILLNAWKEGDRDSELALQLMYASWDLGEQGYDSYTRKLRILDEQALVLGFRQPYEYLGGHQSENCTMLLTAGHMISLFVYRTDLTLSDAEMCLKRFLEICPDGIPHLEFEERGEFGDYFSHIIGYQNRK